MAPKICKVCEDAKSKYKCPICLIPYCSLSCFKEHKESSCEKPDSLPQKDLSAPAAAILFDKPYYVDVPSEVLEQSQLESIASSSEIRDVLKDEQLRKLISDVVSSAEPDKMMDKVMAEGEGFRILSEKILSIIGSKN